MLFLSQVYHKVSSFNILLLYTCSLQYRLALSVGYANVNKDHITSKTGRALFLIGPRAHFSNVVMTQKIWISSVVPPFLEMWVRRKREGVVFSDTL